MCDSVILCDKQCWSPASFGYIRWHLCVNLNILIHSCPPFQHLLSERLTSLGIMGPPRVPPLNPSETIVLSEHYRKSTITIKNGFGYIRRHLCVNLNILSMNYSNIYIYAWLLWMAYKVINNSLIHWRSITGTFNPCKAFELY